LDSGSKELATYFNSHFLSRLGVAGEATPPCVVFFKLTGDKIGEVSIARLDSPSALHGFHELYRVIESYIGGRANVPVQAKFPGWIKGGAGFIGIEAFRAALRKALEHLL
jgi:hypothetical protein